MGASDIFKYLTLSAQKSNCSNHRAQNNSNTVRKDMESTGVGALACARHGCFVPQTVVNFQKGER
jgi:hypothetical protein